MIIFERVKDIQGKEFDLEIEGPENKIIDAKGLTALPAVIDPHVHFRVPGMEYKEDWETGARSAIAGGCTMVFDMPNTLPPTFTRELLKDKKAIIDAQLKSAKIPLRYDLFFGADKHHFDQIPLVAKEVIGIKVFMGCSTGNLVIDDDESLHAIFSLAAKEKMLVAVHAEDEHLLRAKKAAYQGPLDYPVHSILRDIEVATRAVEKAISLSEQYGTRLYVLHISSQEEIDLIKSAKQKGLPVFAETTPHHLFFNTDAYTHLNGRAVVNPPLRDAKHHQALLTAIHDKVIDTIGSDHAPHTQEEKAKPYGQCPSGMPGIEFMLPLLLNAHHQGLFSLEEIISLTSRRARQIFNIPPFNDWVLVDLEKTATITHTHSKCAWSPYMGMALTGWPVYTVLKGEFIKNDQN